MKLKSIYLAFFSDLHFFVQQLVQQQEQNIAEQISTNGNGMFRHTKITELIYRRLSTVMFSIYNDGSVVGTKDNVSVTGTWAASIPRPPA